jgi:type I restriction enzyme, S subunit
MTRYVLSKYDSYKDSGVNWLGKVPANWKVIRNKQIFKERDNLSMTGKETLLTVSHITGVTPRSEKNVNMFMAESMEGYKICHKGDLVINTMWAWMGALGTSNYFGICSPAYNVYMPNKNIPYDHRYFDYLYRTPNSIMEMTRNSRGIVSSRLRLYPKDFFQILTVLPDIATQRAIADYLDTKTAQIDHRIQLLEQKAEKYTELKQSLINETVTRGLSKNIPMKDSGVEWIGQVPAHWEVRRLKDVTQIHTGSKNTEDNLEEGIYPFFVRSQTIERINSYTFDGEAILTAGDGAGVGKVFHYINGKFDYHQRVYKISHFRKVIGKFVFYYMRENFHRDALRLTAKATVDSLRMPMFQNFPIAFGSVEEQNTIVDYLDSKTMQIERIIEIINTEIEKLKELRKTLINDVVTGKIKVL